MRVTVTGRSLLAEGIIGLELAATEGALPDYAPGAHIDVRLPSGLLRQYSLWERAAATERYKIAVLREDMGRGGSAEVHDLALGQALEISAPRNTFALKAHNMPVTLIAGGIGITPILAMAQELAATGRAFDLHYAAKSPAHMAFADLIAQSSFAQNTHLYFDDQAQALDIAALTAQPRPIYACGPRGLIEALQCRIGAWPEGLFNHELFRAPDAEAADFTRDQPFQIEILSTGACYTVGADQTALQVLEEAGFDIPKSCEQGICGSCLTPMKGGSADHRDYILTEAEQAAQGVIALCCSRAKSPKLILDL